MKKRKLTEREKMLKYINGYNDKYDCIFIKITNFYNAEHVGEMTDEQLREVCQNLYENSRWEPDKIETKNNSERE